MANAVLSRDTISGKEGKVYAIVDNKYEQILGLKKYVCKAKINKQPVSQVGTPIVQQKLKDIEWSVNLDYYYGTPLWARLIMRYKKTGEFPDIKVVSINDDKQSSYGKQETMIKGFVPDEVIISELDESTATLENSMGGTASDCDQLEEFNDRPSELLN